MLNKILEYFKKANQTITLNELSQKLKVSPSALEGMLDLLVKKKKLKVEHFKFGPGSENKCQGKISKACICCTFHSNDKKDDQKSSMVKYYYLGD